MHSTPRKARVTRTIWGTGSSSPHNFMMSFASTWRLKLEADAMSKTMLWISRRRCSVSVKTRATYQTELLSMAVAMACVTEKQKRHGGPSSAKSGPLFRIWFGRLVAKMLAGKCKSCCHLGWIMAWRSGTSLWTMCMAMVLMVLWPQDSDIQTNTDWYRFR